MTEETKMRNRMLAWIVVGLLWAQPLRADDGFAFDYGFALGAESGELDGLSLGDDPDVERLDERDFEIEFDLEYQVDDRLYFFFTGALVDESESVEPRGEDETLSGLERKQIGVGLLFGDEVSSELNLGRMEFESASDWWVWWDEELDAIRLETEYRSLEGLLAFAREQARETTDDDFIDPELDGVGRVIASLAWEFAPAQSIAFYYLDQDDDSTRFAVGDFEQAGRIDEEDADLRWTGLGYFGAFSLDGVGEFDVEWHYARVSGDETVYEFDDPDPVTGLAEVVERERGDVRGSARGLLLGYSPARLDGWRFVVGRAVGSGDGDPDDARDDAYQQNGLQGDAEAFGELFQPELSNLEIGVVGAEWRVNDRLDLALLRYDYRQRKRADELRDAAIEVDPDGASRDLGDELDLVLTFRPAAGVEIVVTAAEFDAGEAYSVYPDDSASYVNIELSWEF